MSSDLVALANFVMKLAIVTGRAPHHRRLCASLFRSFDVVGIIHPTDNTTNGHSKLRNSIRRAKECGFILAALNIFGTARARSAIGLSPSKQPSGFLATNAEYDHITRGKIFNDCDVRSEKALALLAELQPDVTAFLGGPVYPTAFIQKAGLALNYHSGISPIYNGTSSIHFAFANGHPHLCGGTLMVMGAKVDGGRILGHYLPEIRSGDSPDLIFEKTTSGAEVMYSRLLNHLTTSGTQLPCVPQPRPLFYTRGFDFCWYHTKKIRRNIQMDVCGKYKRPEAIVEYWREPSTESALKLYHSTLNRLLWGGN